MISTDHKNHSLENCKINLKFLKSSTPLKHKLELTWLIVTAKNIILLMNPSLQSSCKQLLKVATHIKKSNSDKCL